MSRSLSVILCININYHNFMKPHTLHRLYKAIMFVVLASIVIFVYKTNPDFLKAPKAESALAQNVSGFAWSGGATSNDGIGWISFNDISDGSGQTYGVSIDTAGNFSGNAWSENIGWISFNRTATNNPPFPPYDSGAPTDPIAKVNMTNGTVTGWARAISGCEQTPGVPVSTCASSNAGAAAGGWDGWIKLSAETTDPVQYGVTINSAGQFSGYAWGGDVVGWVLFSGTATDGSSYSVNANFPACTIANVPPASWGPCIEEAGFCSSNPPGTSIPRTETGTCGFGFTGTATRVCVLDPVTYCPLPVADCGDTVCSGAETLLTCHTDCKGKVKQF